MASERDMEIRVRINPPDPGAVDGSIAALEQAVERLKRTYTSQREHAWERYARNLRARVQHQRSEIRLLHAKVRELRADAHESLERAEAAEREIALIIEGPS